jgi:HEAT repeat protein
MLAGGVVIAAILVVGAILLLPRRPRQARPGTASSAATWQPRIHVNYSDGRVAHWGDRLTARKLSDRVAAANALAEMGPRASQAVPALLHAQTKPGCEIEIQAACRRALKAIDTAAIPELLAALKSHRPKMRFQAAMALAKLGPEAASAVHPLIDVLTNDSDYSVRTSAATALGAVGPAASAALPALKRAAGNPNQKLTHDPKRAELRVRAWAAIRQIRGQAP